jgi:hypothetical protein
MTENIQTLADQILLQRFAPLVLWLTKMEILYILQVELEYL